MSAVAGNEGSADRYRSFAALRRREREGRDYRIELRRASPRLAVVAIHGGEIEPGTGQIADAVAGREFSFYCFHGIKAAGNRALHLTATCFDEPRAAALVAGSTSVLAVHGCRGPEERVTAGGRDTALAGKIVTALRVAGFPADARARAGLRGRHPDNICNRGLGGAGVQLEITAGLRRKMLRVPAAVAVFDRFVAAVRGVLPLPGG